jgi:hypothetical protein
MPAPRESRTFLVTITIAMANTGGINERTEFSIQANLLRFEMDICFSF